jgi:RND family efflux transporter MFP subunit
LEINQTCQVLRLALKKWINSGVFMFKANKFDIKQMGLIGASVLGLILLLMYMQGSFEHKVSPGSVKPQPLESVASYKTAVVSSTTLNDMFAWPGTVHSRTVAAIAPKIAARILEVKVKVGDKVSKGDVIARLDDRDIRAKENEALAALAGANAQANRAAADAQRISHLYKQEAATRENLDNVQAQAKASQAAVNQAQSAVNGVRTFLDDAVLRAPFSGVIVEKLKEAGDMGLTGEPVVTMQTAQDMRLEVSVPSQCAVRLNSGMTVTVRIDNLGSTLSANIDEIAPEIDPQTRSQLIKIKLPELKGLQPGYLGWLDQACEQHQALLIPNSAVIRVGQLESVKVLTQGEISLRHIRTAKTFADKIEVISGLRVGETVVTNP